MHHGTLRSVYVWLFDVIYADCVKQRKADLGVRGWIAEVGLWIWAGKKVWEGRGDGSDGVVTVRLAFGSRGQLPTSRANIVLGDNLVFAPARSSRTSVLITVTSR